MRPSSFGAKQIMTRHSPKEKEEIDAVGSVSGATSGALAGAKLGTKAAPYLATIPGVGQVLSVAAPVVGGAVGGLWGGIQGAKGQGASPSQVSDEAQNYADAREKAAKTAAAFKAKKLADTAKKVAGKAKGA